MPGIRPVSASSPPALRSRARSATITMTASQAGLSTQQEELIRRIKAGETGLFLTALFCYRSGRGQNCDRGRRNQLDRAGVNCQKSAHRICRDAGPRIKRLQITHCAQAQRRSRIAQAEHVGRHVHYHATHRWMFRRNVGKKAAHDGSQTVRDLLHQSRALGQTHHAEPQRHDPDQRQRNRDGGFRAIECASSHIFKPVVPAADCYSKQNQRKPDVI